MLSDTATTVRSLRRPTLDTLGLGSVLEIFRAGRLPISAEQAVEAVFGPAGDRGALVISFRDGLIGHERRIYDFTGMLIQLGVIKPKL